MDQSRSAASPGEASEAERLEQAMQETPSGAIALAGITVFLLVFFWFVVYLFVFLPRGLVG
ncbi:MAG: cytochrome c oxidase subunit 2A [Acetobacteraceae bacterium]|nr:cytochrome c oxidase subunit 2A [Acetobacteraceae bacterium]MBV8574158.1 cytochrome c oxidase subunit 2A [Acetobacteraceae bacterium]